MEIQSFVFNPFYENTYVLWDDTLEGIVIDPGCFEKYEFEELKEFIESKGINLKAIVNTHAHIDHVLGNYELSQHYDIPIWMPGGEMEVLRAVVAYAPQWGIQNYTHAEPSKMLSEDDTISFGHTELAIIYAPGHSPGHFIYYHKNQDVVIGGDVLFRESIGRSDLPGGNHQQLLDSIRQKLYTLPTETIVYPGHGPQTTIGHEQSHNPFIRKD